MTVDVANYAPADPYIEQIAHFVRVIEGAEAPLVSAEDATRTLQATLAVAESARLGQTITLD